jgi:hypothetical protein
LVVLTQKHTRDLVIEAVLNLGRASHPHRLGEGVIGKVVETGRQTVVPRASLEPSVAAMLKADTGTELSFMCLPIVLDRQTIGALGVAVKYLPDRNFDRSAKFLGIVASMVGQAIKVQRLVAQQHKRLVTENARLKQELRDRRVEITGPVDRKMIINALNSGSNVFMADFEDSCAPTWGNVVEGQQNLADAVRRTIAFTDGKKSYALRQKVAVLFVRPRGWHLDEKHLRIDGADAFIARAVDAGATIQVPAADHPHGERSGSILDPFGHRWLIGNAL